MFKATRKYEKVFLDPSLWGNRVSLSVDNGWTSVAVTLTRKELKKLKKEIGRVLDKTKEKN